MSYPSGLTDEQWVVLCKASVSGARAGIKVGFPDFKAKHCDTPRFWLRSKSAPGESAPVRFVDPTHLLLPKLGAVRVKGCARRVRRMVAAGRFHVHSATVTHKAGRWYVSLNGVAGQFHPNAAATRTDIKRQSVPTRA